jgi:FkbM family methyltransferase
MLRGLLALYPTRKGAAWINRRLDLFFEDDKPNWLLAPSRGGFPKMVLNVSTNLQRKLFYFPRIYARFYGDTVFARYLRQRLTPGSKFLDIGANVGFFSLLAAPLVGEQGAIYAFEPEPDICEALARSAEANGFANVHALQVALSDHQGEADFYRARDGTASSLVAETPERAKRYERTLTTRVTTLDRLVEEGAIDPLGVTLIKIDVEGEEPRTVMGMLETLPIADYPSIWCEVRGPEGSTRAPNTYPAVRDTLAELGYVPNVWTDDGPRAVTDDDVLGRADILFERP